MKKIFAAVLGASAIAAVTPAAATDFFAAAAPMTTWTGFYGGFDAGYNWASAETSVPASPLAGTATPHPDSVTLGGHIGYLHQFAQPLVLGIEADVSWLNGDAYSAASGNPTQGTQAQTNWDGSVRAIVGYPINQTLFYATGGWAWISSDGCAALTATSTTCFANTSHSNTYNGWTVGAGIARPLALLHGAIARVEYLHSDYGSVTVTGSGWFGGTANVALKSDKLRFGLSWKIGEP